MKRWSLKLKLFILILFPILSNLYYLQTYVSEEWKAYESAQVENSKAQVFENLLKFIHHVQIERGRSALFASGGDRQAVIQKRKEVDELGKGLSASLFGSQLKQEIQNEINENQNQISSLRNEVDSGLVPAEIVKKYSKIIENFFRIENQISLNSKLTAELMGVVNLEPAKEFAGLARARGASILKKNLPLEIEQEMAFRVLVTNLQQTVDSKASTLSLDGRNKINEILKGTDWQFFRDSFSEILKKSKTGNYEINADLYFSHATQVVDGMLNVFLDEFVVIKEMLKMQKENTQKDLMIAIGRSLFFFAVFLGISFYFYKEISVSIVSSTSHLSGSSDRILGAFEELRTQSRQISEGANSSASALEQTVASISEISSIMSSTAQHSENASKLANECKNIADRGAEKFLKLQSVIEDLTDNSGKMEIIIQTIDDIAFQINLLALNAAVEAARAGEQGRGFAVVADAVRSLAQKSATSAKEIHQLVSLSREKVTAGSVATQDSGQAMKELAQSIEKVKLIITEIAEATQEEKVGLEQISSAMNHLDRSTQQNALSATQTSQSADDLKKETDQLQFLIGKLNQLIEGQRAAS